MPVITGVSFKRKEHLLPWVKQEGNAVHAALTALTRLRIDRAPRQKDSWEEPKSLHFLAQITALQESTLVHFYFFDDELQPQSDCLRCGYWT